MLTLTWPPKHHLAVKEYGVDWGARFPNDPLVSAVFTVASGGVQLTDQAKSGSIAQVTVSGGVTSAQNVILRKPAGLAVITCVIETESGRVDAVAIIMEIL